MVISREGLDIDEEPSMKRQKGEIVVDVVVAPSEEEKKEKEEIQSHAVYDGLDDDDEEHTIDPAIEEELMQSTSMDVPLSSSSLAIKVSPDLQVIPSSSSSSAVVSQHHSSVIYIYWDVVLLSINLYVVLSIHHRSSAQQHLTILQHLSINIW